MTRLIESKAPRSNKVVSKSLLLEGDELKIAHSLNLNHLSKLTIDNLNRWQAKHFISGKPYPLDILYRMMP